VSRPPDELRTAVSAPFLLSENEEGGLRMRDIRAALLALLVVAGALTSGSTCAVPECGSIVTADVTLTRDLVCEGPGLIVGASGITIDLNGFTLSGSGERAGIRIDEPYDAVTVRNGVVQDFARALQLDGVSNVVITDLSIRNASIEIEGGGGAQVVGNEISGGGIFLIAENSPSHRIAGNRIHGSPTAIGIEADASAIVVDNEIFDNAFGIDTSQLIGLHVEGNDFHDNDVGVLLQQAAGADLLDNDFTGQRIAVWLRFESSGTATGNRIVQNRIGFQVGSGDPDDSILIEYEIRDNLFASNGAAGILLLNADQLEGSRIEQNELVGNGFAPEGVTNNAGETVDDGIQVEGGPAPDLTLASNRVFGNADYGIEAPGVVDGGGNVAKENGNPDQCLGVECRIVPPGDLDGDGDVDRDDLDQLLPRRDEAAFGPRDPGDLDRDGRITGLDARRLVLLCTRTRCATG
jgi:hypothetical protein